MLSMRTTTVSFTHHILNTVVTKGLLASLLSGILFSSLIPPMAQAHTILDDLPFHFMAIGDAPYRKDQLPRFKQMIRQMNDEHPTFSVHIGDTVHPHDKAANRLVCSNEDYNTVFREFSAIKHPLFYTPGDNEWVDCDTDPEFPYNPNERLTQIRSQFFPPTVFYPIPTSFQWKSQASQPAFKNYVENQRWHVGTITFATLHIVGTHNNLQEGKDTLTEFEARNAANIAWLAETFNEATVKKREGIVLFFHANPMFEADSRNRFGFNPFIAELTRHAKAYTGKILLIHGDSHRFLVDYPLRDPETGYLLPNVTRVVVFGDPDLYLTHITVQPHHEPLFVIEPLLSPTDNFPVISITPSHVPLPAAP